MHETLSTMMAGRVVCYFSPCLTLLIFNMFFIDLSSCCIVCINTVFIILWITKII